MPDRLTKEEFLHHHHETKDKFIYEMGRHIAPLPSTLVPANIEISPDNLLLVQIDLEKVFVTMADAAVEAAVETVYGE